VPALSRRQARQSGRDYRQTSFALLGIAVWKIADCVRAIDGS
jgi:hypothetical protein